MKQLICIFFQLSLFFTLQAQSVGIGTLTPNASAQLEIYSSSKGLLIPQIALTNIATAAPVASPATGLLVYNTNAATTGGNGAGFYYWAGASWLNMQSGNTNGWGILGNAGTTATNFIGTTDNNPLSIKTNNLEVMKISASGNVGIGGSTNPVNRFEVQGASILANSTPIDVTTIAASVIAGKITEAGSDFVTGIAGKAINPGSTWAVGGAIGDFFIASGNNTTASSLQIGLQIKSNRNVLVAPVSGNVAIGGNGANPGSKLTVYGSVAYPVRFYIEAGKCIIKNCRFLNQ